MAETNISTNSKINAHPSIKNKFFSRIICRSEEESGSRNECNSNPGVQLGVVDSNLRKLSRDQHLQEGGTVHQGQPSHGRGDAPSLHAQGVRQDGEGQSALSQQLGRKGLESGALLRESPCLEGGLGRDAALHRGEGEVGQEVLEDGGGVGCIGEERSGDEELGGIVDVLHGNTTIAELLGGAVEDVGYALEGSGEKAHADGLEGWLVGKHGAQQSNDGGDLIPTDVGLDEGGDAIHKFEFVHLVHCLGRQVVEGAVADDDAGVDLGHGVDVQRTGATSDSEGGEALAGAGACSGARTCISIGPACASTCS